MTRDAFASFGTVLKGFRTRRELTQQQLAEKLGVRRNTIGSWERGDFLPQSKGVVLELARHLHLDDEEICQLLEASLTALAPHWLVPLRRNPYFTGREEILEAMYTQLGFDQTVALTQSSALHGLGGVGKTQIALEYAYRHALDYSAVFWIEAEKDEQIVASLLRIAETLQLPGQNEKDQQRVIAAVQRWLSTHGQWLLIWDNVEDLTLLDRFLPSARLGAILLTTRLQALGALARGLDLLPMEQEEGLLFLLRRAKVLEPEATSKQVDQFAERMPAQSAAASELVTVLGGLPLALDQAGAYLEETHCALPAYLNLFRNQRATLLQQRGEGTREHPASVATTFTLAIATTAQRHPAIWDLLRVCALLQPDAIPEELFRQGAEHLGTALEAACRDELEWNRVVAMACAYSLLSRQPEEQTLSVHRLVQAVLLDTMTEAEQEQWNRRAIEALNVVFPDVLPDMEYTDWKQCERLLPHTLLCLCQAGMSEESLALASLASKAAQYLCERGQYAEAEPLYLRALHVREQVMGSGHSLVAYVLNNLANLYLAQGKYEQAEPLHMRALQIWERVLCAGHSLAAYPLNNLANLYLAQGKYAQGKYEQAEPLHIRALQLCERLVGPNHSLVAYPLNNLANLYLAQGKYEQAEPLFQRALQIREWALSPDHPDVAESLSGLALLCRDQGKYTEAERLYQRALSIREQHLGQHHPETAETLHDLAIFCQMQGHLHEAISLTERALKIRLQSLGDAHPKTLASRTLYAQLEEVKEAVRDGEPVPLSGKESSSHTRTDPLREEAVLTPLETGERSSFEDDLLQGFLEACCELHPHAWCSSADLWQAYQHWREEQQERYPLSRGAFIAQLKAHGCRADRTMAARIWHGIAVVKKEI
jgi:tetratricopeptide (TPR) repeat protein